MTGSAAAGQRFQVALDDDSGGLLGHGKCTRRSVVAFRESIEFADHPHLPGRVGRKAGKGQTSKINDAVEDYVDEIAERAVQLGGVAEGTARIVAKWLWFVEAHLQAER